MFDGVDLLALSPRGLRAIRGRDISFVFQEPMTSLNPVLKVGRQIGEVLTKHLGVSRRRGACANDRAAAARAHPGARGAGSTSTRTSCPAACGSA